MQGQRGIAAAKEDQATGAFPFHQGLEGRTKELRSLGDAAELLRLPEQFVIKVHGDRLMFFNGITGGTVPLGGPARR